MFGFELAFGISLGPDETEKPHRWDQKRNATQATQHNCTSKGSARESSTKIESNRPARHAVSVSNPPPITHRPGTKVNEKGGQICWGIYIFHPVINPFRYVYICFAILPIFFSSQKIKNENVFAPLIQFDRCISVIYLVFLSIYLFVLLCNWCSDTIMNHLGFWFSNSCLDTVLHL